MLSADDVPPPPPPRPRRRSTASSSASPRRRSAAASAASLRRRSARRAPKAASSEARSRRTAKRIDSASDLASLFRCSPSSALARAATASPRRRRCSRAADASRVRTKACHFTDRHCPCSAPLSARRCRCCRKDARSRPPCWTRRSRSAPSAELTVAPAASAARQAPARKRHRSKAPRAAVRARPARRCSKACAAVERCAWTAASAAEPQRQACSSAAAVRFAHSTLRRSTNRSTSTRCLANACRMASTVSHFAERKNSVGAERQTSNPTADRLRARRETKRRNLRLALASAAQAPTMLRHNRTSIRTCKFFRWPRWARSARQKLVRHAENMGRRLEVVLRRATADSQASFIVVPLRRTPCRYRWATVSRNRWLAIRASTAARRLGPRCRPSQTPNVCRNLRNAAQRDAFWMSASRSPSMAVTMAPRQGPRAALYCRQRSLVRGRDRRIAAFGFATAP
mmetsp:Transcript_177385/g.568794  ORF Transcript_177385/g.568794 Transcript_177385/m.568794 type:complete len:458 (+) Transcript_177385:634-2007(+)